MGAGSSGGGQAESHRGGLAQSEARGQSTHEALPMKPPSWSTVPSKFSREEAQTWKRWLDNPDGAKPHQDAGSRARAKSLAAKTRASVDELYELMVKRGVVAK